MKRTAIPHAIVSGTSSDSHMWNLVFLELLLKEMNFEVVNLGVCVFDQMLVDACLGRRFDLVAISTVNGHGHNDGLRLIRKLRTQPALARTKIVIGGKLGVADDEAPMRRTSLLGAGFDGVFEGDSAVDAFRGFVSGFINEVTEPVGAAR